MTEIASHKALEQIWEVCGAANRYVDAQAPWALRKTDPARMATVLWVLAETVRRLAILTQPFMPHSSAKLLDLLAVPEGARSFAAFGDALRPGTPLPAPDRRLPAPRRARGGMIVDSHCHLDYPGLAEDEAGVVERARAAGVGIMVHIAAKRAGWPVGIALAERRPEVFCAVGVHPHEAGTEGLDDPAPLIELASHPAWSRSARAASTISTTSARATGRRRASAPTSAAARATGLPLVVHTRDADDDTMALLEAEMAAGAVHRRHPLLQLQPPPRRARGRSRPLSRHRRHPHLQEVRRAARHRARHAARPPAAGDRRALPRPGAHARPDQRARLHRPRRQGRWPRFAGLPVAEIEAATTANFRRLFAKAAAMRVTVLGCGTSSGVPQIGCDCAVCRSPDPRNSRRRCSIFIEAQGQRILVDTGPDLRQQCLDAGIGEIDALLYTHAHADHVHGIDDLRTINNLIMAPVPA